MTTHMYERTIVRMFGTKGRTVPLPEARIHYRSHREDWICVEMVPGFRTFAWNHALDPEAWRVAVAPVAGGLSNGDMREGTLHAPQGISLHGMKGRGKSSMLRLWES